VERTLKVILALLIVASLVLVLAPAALSQYGPPRSGDGNRTPPPPPEEIYMVISAKNVTGTSATFDVTGEAVRTADGRAMVGNYTTPRAGEYFFGNDTAIISGGERPHKGERVAAFGKTGRHRPMAMGNRSPGERGPPPGGQRPVMGYYNNSTINVAGATAVVAMKNITGMTHLGNRTVQFQFTDMLVYLPDGSTTTHKLSTPVTVTIAGGTITVKANPDVRGILQGFIGSGNRFPANAGPVKLMDIDAIK
jgi:hypothetical protein